MISNIINHIVFVIDRSGSMSSLSREVVQVFDKQIKYLARRSQELDQETRATVYLFGSRIECIIFDKDVLRLPSLEGLYKIEGMTALIDATLLAVDDLSKTFTKYGDHSFLLYVLTDGQENCSATFHKVEAIKKRIEQLDDNWTMAVMVPDQDGVFEAKRFGFPANNVERWSTTAKGLAEAGDVMERATDTYFRARATGQRGTKSLFTLDDSHLTKSKVSRKLHEVRTGKYTLLTVKRETQIAPFVAHYCDEYVKGCAFYQLMKKETIQANKEVCVRDKSNGKIFTGKNARSLLNLPDFEVKVQPGDFDNFDVFVQSTSVNRKLLPGTQVLVL